MRTNNKLNPHMAPSPGIEPRATLVGGECSHHCAMATPSIPVLKKFVNFHFEFYHIHVSNIPIFQFLANSRIHCSVLTWAFSNINSPVMSRPP